ncbi:mitogen-activated protein kinase kinase kinase 3 [Aegilops tauschii subsp. strangulata]|nr:mitogen-activated protein kinase kinase kinase 1 [Aegilops tauschii subsp. strangulata]
MGTPQRPRPRQLARTNAMRNSSYTADAGADGDGDLAAYGGIQLSVDRAARASPGARAGYASQTSFRIHGGRGGGEEVAELFRQLGLSGPEDFAIPPAVYAAANAARRRASLEESSPAASPSGVPEISGRHVIVASRLQPAGDGEEAGLATELVQSESIQVSAKAYQRPWAESKAMLVESERVETSTREVAAVSEPENAGEEKGGDKLAKVETLREERTREVVVEATRDATGGALALVVAESTSCDIEHLVSPSPNRRFRRTITSWIKGGHIGSGSFGSVYEAISDDGFFFAVKEVSLIDQGINAKQRIVQLEHEVSLLSRLEHDNIVQYYGTDKEDGKLYIFLELVTQGSLAALYQKYCLQDSQVSAYTRQILNGLNYLHQRNVLHRDIKCANILVDANGLVKLADFGLAKEMSILSQARSSKGTVFWMAPEVAKAKPHGPPADIWSLGCTVLEMLTGKVPYPDMEWTHALLKIGRGIPPKIPNTLSEDARDFIAKCVQANQKDRPSAAQLLEHPFVKRPLQH